MYVCDFEVRQGSSDMNAADLQKQFWLACIIRFILEKAEHRYCHQERKQKEVEEQVSKPLGESRPGEGTFSILIRADKKCTWKDSRFFCNKTENLLVSKREPKALRLV